LTEHTSAAEASTEAVADSTECDVINDQKQQFITHQGRLLLDATVAEQTIRFPTDLSLLNESREISERLIDELCELSSLTKKPRTYRKIARSAYLAIVKQYWVIQHIYSQQAEMYRTKSHRCDDRIVSIHQPHVRPIIRGKLNKSVEFGAKISVNLTPQGIAKVDHLRWDAFNEGGDLETQVEAYLRRYGFYPEAVVADPVYGTQKNRAYLKDKGIRYAGKALGRPKKVTEQNREQLKRDKQQRQVDYRQRIPIEGKFSQGKRAYGLNQIQAKTARTSEAWINSIFLVMNLLVLLQHFFVLEIVQRCINKFIEFLLQKTKRIFITPIRLMTKGYFNSWLLSF
jgi:hypothetical protein